MKNNKIKLYSNFICLMTSVMIFAQPGSGSDLGNLETPDPAAPIDTMLIVLIMAGISLAYLTVRYKRKIT